MTASTARRDLSTLINRPFGWVPIPVRNPRNRYWEWTAGQYGLTRFDGGLFSLYFDRDAPQSSIPLKGDQGAQMAIDFIKQVKAWRRDNP
jgi:hypothetical protein